MFAIRFLILVILTFVDSFLLGGTVTSLNINTIYHVPFVVSDNAVMQNDLFRNLVHVVLVGCLTSIVYVYYQANENDDENGGENQDVFCASPDLRARKRTVLKMISG